MGRARGSTPSLLPKGVGKLELCRLLRRGRGLGRLRKNQDMPNADRRRESGRAGCGLGLLLVRRGLFCLRLGRLGRLRLDPLCLCRRRRIRLALGRSSVGLSLFGSNRCLLLCRCRLALLGGQCGGDNTRQLLLGGGEVVLRNDCRGASGRTPSGARCDMAEVRLSGRTVHGARLLRKAVQLRLQCGDGLRHRHRLGSQFWVGR